MISNQPHLLQYEGPLDTEEKLLQQHAINHWNHISSNTSTAIATRWIKPPQRMPKAKGYNQNTHSFIRNAPPPEYISHRQDGAYNNSNDYSTVFPTCVNINFELEYKLQNLPFNLSPSSDQLYLEYTNKQLVQVE